jgi:hypothetical protein
MRKTASARTEKSDGPWLVLAVLLLIFVFAATASENRIFTRTVPVSSAPVANPSKTTADDLKTGSIFLLPMDGNVCEHRVIDNSSWRIYPGGLVACEEAVALVARPSGPTFATRIEAIRDGFNPKR